MCLFLRLVRFDMKNCEGATVGVRFLPELSIRSVVGTQCAREGLHQFETDLPPKNWSRHNVRMWTEEGEELNSPLISACVVNTY